MLRPDLIGDYPSLTDLERGELKYMIDFRTVNAGVLEKWSKAFSRKAGRNV